MRKLLLFVMPLILVGTLFGAKNHEFQAAKLLDITADERLVEGTTVRHAIFTVQVGELVYTARGGHIRHHGGDYGQGLVIGDSVQVSIDKDHLILLKPDGKELQTKIIKRVRGQSQ